METPLTLDYLEWEKLSYDQYSLTILDILKLNPGDRIKVLIMSKGDCAMALSGKHIVGHINLPSFLKIIGQYMYIMRVYVENYFLVHVKIMWIQLIRIYINQILNFTFWIICIF